MSMSVLPRGRSGGFPPRPHYSRGGPALDPWAAPGARPGPLPGPPSTPPRPARLGPGLAPLYPRGPRRSPWDLSPPGSTLPRPSRRPRRSTGTCGRRGSHNSPWQKAPLHSTGDASRLTALFLGRIWPICSLVTPCQPGASPVSVRRGVSPRADKVRYGPLSIRGLSDAPEGASKFNRPGSISNFRYRAN